MAKQRTQTMAELEQGLFTEIKQPDPKPQPKPESPKPQPPEPETPKPEPNPEPKPKKPLPKWLIPAVAAVAVLAAGIGVWTGVIKPANDYKAAQALLDAGEYGKAMIKFAGLNYKDSAQLAQEAKQSYWATQQLPLAAGWYHTVGLRSDGTLATTGDNGLGQCDVSGWTDIVAVAAGGNHTLGLRSDGTVVATGYNFDGQCDVSGWRDIVAVAAGSDYTVGLCSDGTLVATGDNGSGQRNVSSWTDIRTP